MKKTVIQAVLFDFGGVLAEEGFHNALLALASEQGLDADNLISAGMQAVYDSGFVLGHGTAAQFWQLMRLRTGLAGEDSELTQRVLDGFVVRPWIIQRIQDLREQGCVTGILSDQTHWLDTLDELYHFSDVFDHVYNSYYLGKGKRDPSLFTYVANDLDMDPSQIMFVDDNAGNVQRARDAGMQALLYVDQEGFLSDLDKALSKV